jgi:hypothetical protein
MVSSGDRIARAPWGPHRPRMVSGVLDDPSIQGGALQNGPQGLQKLVDRSRGHLAFAVQLDNPLVDPPGAQVAKPFASPGGDE